MIAPHELKNKTFSRAVRGYNPVEVDQYFDFLIEKYTEAYKAATELEQKFNQVEAKYTALSSEEESIRSAILKAQKLGEAIVNNAKNEAKEKEAKLNALCDEIIEEARAKVAEEKEKAAQLRKSAIEFQHKLYTEYLTHLETVKNMKLEEMTDADDLQAENEHFARAKDEVLNGAEVSIITNQSDSSSNEEI